VSCVEVLLRSCVSCLGLPWEWPKACAAWRVATGAVMIHPIKPVLLLRQPC
jgi:hypothetical protein